MLTIILATLFRADMSLILGYILSGCEVLIVALTLISFFVPSDSKFGRFLSRILKGLYKSKQYIITKDEKSEEKEDETNEDNTK